MRTLSAQEILDQLRRTAASWSSPLMQQHLEGAQTFAVALLIDLPETNMTEAERLVNQAITAGLVDAQHTPSADQPPKLIYESLPTPPDSWPREVFRQPGEPGP